MSEWLACEEVVREREKEQHAAALAKCSSGASVDSSSQRMTHHDSTVFESVEEVDQPELESKTEEAKQVPKMPNGAVQNESSSPDSGHPSSRNFSITSGLSDGSFSTEDSSAPDASQRSTAALQMLQGSTKPAGGENEPLTIKSQVASEEKSKGWEGKEEEKTFDSINKKSAKLHPGTQENIESENMKKEETKVDDKGLKMNIKESPQEDILGVSISGRAYSSSQKDETQALTESDESPSAIEMEEIPKAKVSMAPWSRRGHCEASSFSEDSAPHVELRQEVEKLSPEGTESILSEPEMESLYPPFDSLPADENTKNDVTSQESTGIPYSVCTPFLRC
ncbi:hypothetical protein GOODEAATRI_002624 [Goodea atripinnis]|uniref:Uncharacterized protein n=1 Tax=Goodea atripinnis TaxID=208336 RepID=A0ABV0N8D7_9TELE